MSLILSFVSCVLLGMEPLKIAASCIGTSLKEIKFLFTIGDSVWIRDGGM